MTKNILLKGLIAPFVLLSGIGAAAQSNNFNLAKNLDIQHAVLRNVAALYVDTVDFDKIIPEGIDAMLATLDPYTNYIRESEEEGFELMTTGNYGGIGAMIRKKVDGPVIIYEPYANTPAVKYGLEPGDEIWAIDGKSVIGETSDSASSRMKGQPDTKVVFKVCKGRSRDTVEISPVRERIHVPSVEYAGIIRDSIGYIAVNGFTDKVAEEFKAAFLSLKERGMKRLVIDLRDNGGGIMDEAVNMVSLFVPKGTLVMSSRGRSPQMNKQYYTHAEPVDTSIPILVMVNSASASASEIFSGALQDLDRATIAGKRTFGKGLIQSVLPVPYDGKVKVTTGKYYTPSGRCVQAIDYSHRNEDGSVGYVPDSLRHQFKTAKGRTVYDGGGITPDIESDAHVYSRPVIAMVYAGIIGDYSIEYYKKHKSIPAPEEFHLSDAEFEDFVEYAAAQDFDARSGAEAVLDDLKKAARKDYLFDEYKAEIEALEAKIKVDKKTMLRMKKDELVNLIEENIVIKYHYTPAASIIMLRRDTQMDKALDKWMQEENV